MAAMRCPACGLINPASTTACDCGWSFTRGMMGEPRQIATHHPEQDRRAWAQRQLAIGAVLLLIGIIITAATYGSASQSGGTYIIAYGPIVVGVIKIIRGLAAMGR
ncbi:MAG: hypothetical protein E6J90_28835 [Deltaproteobacteria bacterium]|nr:MAG: hypothetical protein E6J90_28835 [Deltaproteobacteria bacterium]